MTQFVYKIFRLVILEKKKDSGHYVTSATKLIFVIRLVINNKFRVKFSFYA